MVDTLWCPACSRRTDFATGFTECQLWRASTYAILVGPDAIRICRLASDAGSGPQSQEFRFATASLITESQFNLTTRNVQGPKRRPCSERDRCQAVRSLPSVGSATQIAQRPAAQMEIGQGLATRQMRCLLRVQRIAKGLLGDHPVDDKRLTPGGGNTVDNVVVGKN